MSEIWTVGHSNKFLDDFLILLRAHDIQAVADVRRFPVSKRHPHFSRDSLGASLKHAGIAYTHFPDLGGRRTGRPDSTNTNWKNAAFRGYADYMETPSFADAVARLKDLSSQNRTAVMCAEALWWQCHRSLLSDFLKAAGWRVTHILGSEKTQEHPYTSAAQIVQGRLRYAPETLFDQETNSPSKQ